VCAAQRVGDNINAGLIVRVSRLVGDHCAAHPQQAAQLLAALGCPCTGATHWCTECIGYIVACASSNMCEYACGTEAQMDQIAVVARMVANTFLADPRTPIDKLQVMLQIMLNPFIAPVSPLSPDYPEPEALTSGTAILPSPSSYTNVQFSCSFVAVVHHRPPELRHATDQQFPTQLVSAGAIPESAFGILAEAFGIASPAASTTADTTTTTTTTTNSIGQPASPAVENATTTPDLWQDEGMQTTYAYDHVLLGGQYYPF